MANKKVRKITKASKRRLVTLGTFSIVLFAIFCLNVCNYTSKIINLTKQEKELVLKLDQLKTEKEELAIEIEKLQDPAYLANYAREKYLYSKDGEYVIKIDETEKTIDEIKHTNTRYKYAIGSSVLLLGVLIVYIIRKR